jgi:hypothetical protein
MAMLGRFGPGKAKSSWEDANKAIAPPTSGENTAISERSRYYPGMEDPHTNPKRKRGLLACASSWYLLPGQYVEHGSFSEILIVASH